MTIPQKNRPQIGPKILTQHLNGRWHGAYGVAPCPVCQVERLDNQDALTISDGIQKLLLHCKKGGCGFRSIMTAAGIVSSVGDYSPAVAQEDHSAQIEKAAKTRARSRALWKSSKTIINSQGEAYLRSRGIGCHLPPSLRWIENAYHTPSRGICSAMIGNVVPTGGVHRTFFTKRGQRLTGSAKMMLGPCRGGAVRLSASSGPLVVCEGIETGLSLLSGILDGPHEVWAALSTSGMKSLVLPKHAGRLIIATDSDDSGSGAHSGKILANRAKAAGWSVSLMPAPIGQDWNDALRDGFKK